MGSYYRKWLLFPTPYEEAVMLATVLGSQLHCDTHRGLRLYVNSAMEDIDQNTDVECQVNQELRKCNLLSAQPSVCQYQCLCPAEGPGCQLALLYWHKQEQVPESRLCELLLT